MGDAARPEGGLDGSINTSGPVGGPFRPGHARAVGAAVEVATRLHAVADHPHAARYSDVGARAWIARSKLSKVPKVRASPPDIVTRNA